MDVSMKLWFLNFIFCAMVNHIEAGCNERKLCCKGRDLTCVAKNDGIIPQRESVGSESATTDLPTPTDSIPNEIPKQPHEHQHGGKAVAVGEKKSFVPSWHIHAGDLNADLPQLKNFFDTLHSRRVSKFANLNMPKETKKPIFLPQDDVELQVIGDYRDESYPIVQETDSDLLDFSSTLDLGSGETSPSEAEGSETTTPYIVNGLEIPKVIINANSTVIKFKDPTSAMKYKLTLESSSLDHPSRSRWSTKERIQS